MNKLFLLIFLLFFSMSCVDNVVYAADAPQIPTTKYVADYFRNYCGNPNLEFNNTDGKKIPSEKYVLTAIDKINGDTNLAASAWDKAPITMDYLKSSVANITDNHSLECCPVWWYDQDISYIAEGDSNLESFAYGKDTFVVNADGVVWVSKNGTDWHAIKGVSFCWGKLVYIGDKFILWHSASASCSGDEEYTYYRYSYDGLTWYEQPLYNGYEFYNIVGVQGILLASTGVIESNLLRSTDGLNWTEVVLPSEIGTISKVYFLTYTNDRFFVSVRTTKGTNGVFSSEDGLTWTKVGSASNHYIDSIVYGNGMYVGFSRYENDFFVSESGVNWSKLDVLDNSLYIYVESILFVDGEFVGVGHLSDGTGRSIILRSVDGVTWLEQIFTRDMLHDSYFDSAVYADGVFYAMTNYNILKSVNLNKWDIVTKDLYEPSGVFIVFNEYLTDSELASIYENGLTEDQLSMLETEGMSVCNMQQDCKCLAFDMTTYMPRSDPVTVKHYNDYTECLNQCPNRCAENYINNLDGKRNELRCGIFTGAGLEDFE